jgi:enterochelin esterase-like enzyme
MLTPFHWNALQGKLKYALNRFHSQRFGMALHQYIRDARKHGTPLIDGDQVTFVWQGDSAPQLFGDFNGWGYALPPIELERVAKGVFAHTMTFDPATYMEYAYFTDFKNGERVPDPFNKKRVNNGFGKFNNYFDMPERQHTTLIKARKDVARGTVTKHTLTHNNFLVGGKRNVWLYRPPTDERVPLVVVFDGDGYLRRQYINNIIDNLIAQGRIRPVALALVANGNQARFMEYMCSEATVSWIAQDVVELATQTLNLLDIAQNPGAYGVLGSSMGGLMSLYMAFRVPEIFGNVMSQSGSVALAFMKQAKLLHQVVEWYTDAPLNIWMDCGMYEHLIDSNRALSELLTAKGHHVTYREFAGWHNVTCWRDELPHAFETLFPLQGE